MSIQPSRVIDRIVRQVDASGWPPLPVRTLVAKDETLLLFSAPADPLRHATPIHFWVHALRDELAARGRRGDLVGAAVHASGRNQSVSAWLEELDALALAEGPRPVDLLGLRSLGESGSRPVEAYRMLESECRRSSVVGDGQRWWAHFWGHGSAPSWRQRVWR